MAKINYFKSSKNLATTMEKFINAKMDDGAIRYHYDFMISSLKKAIRGLNACKGSVLDSEDLDIEIEQKTLDIEILETEKAKKLDNIITYSYTECDKKLLKVFKNATTEHDMALGIVEWYKTYECECPIEYAEDLMVKINGWKVISNKKVVSNRLKDDSIQFVGTNSATTMLKLFLNKVAEECVLAGTVKVKNIDELCRADYETILAEKLAKKLEKEAKKNKKKENMK